MATQTTATYHAEVYEDDGNIVKHWIIDASGKEVWSAWIYDDEDACVRVKDACYKWGVTDSPY